MKRDLTRLTSEQFDLLIIGGGATGCFAARDAAMRGLKVALIEGADFAAATSAHNSKLVHGGLRYLREGEFGLVRESLRERRTLQAIAPHLVRPLSFLLPLYGKGLAGRLTLATGLTLYDLLSYDRGRLEDPALRLPRHGWLKRDAALMAEPVLAGDGFKGAFSYPDAQMFMPERIALENLIDADAHGAALANHVAAEKLILREGRVIGAEATDNFTGTRFDIRARAVLLAMGPWSDLFLERSMGRPATHKLIRSKGIHILVPAMTAGHALTMEAGAGHFFVMPWRGHTLIGTTDTEFKGDPGTVGVRESDIESFLATVNRFLPAARLRREDVLFAYAGLRPLVADGNKGTYGVSRRAELVDHASEGIEGLFSALGGKWTTSRALAQTVTDAVVKKLGVAAQACATATTPLPGGRIDRFEGLVKGFAKTYPGIAAMRHLAHMYGARLPLLLRGAKLADLAPMNVSGDVPAQILFSIREEMALTLEDLVMRRTSIGQFGRPAPQTAGRAGRSDGRGTGLEPRAPPARDRGRGPSLRDRGVKAFVVFNPAANHGRLKHEWPAIAAALKTIFPSLLAVPSGGRGQTARLVRDALRDGYMEIVAVGGDGTINEAVNGFFEMGAPVFPDAVLSVVPAGGGDIGHGMAGGVAAALRLARAHVRPVDLGHVACLTPEGGAATRFFLGAASLGLTGDIARRLNRSRFMPVREAQHYLALAAWRACRVRLMADGGHDEIDGISAVAVMNGAFFGGGLKAASGADPADGAFDIAVLPGGSRRRIGRMFQDLRGGRAVEAVRRLRATHLTAAPTLDTSRPVWVETDGEAAGVLPASFEMAPQALRLRL